MRNFCLVLFAALTMITAEGNQSDLTKEIEMWIPAEIINKKISGYLSTHDLSPYLRPGQQDFPVHFLNPVIEDDSSFVVFLQGDFLKGNFLQGTPKGVFYLHRDKNSTNVEVQLLYIAMGNPVSPSPVLFFDILMNPGFSLMYPKALELYTNQNAHIFISSNPLEKGVTKQTWTFFTPYEKCEAFVILQDDGSGGTHIMIPFH